MFIQSLLKVDAGHQNEGIILLVYRALGKREYLMMIFLIFHQSHML